MTAPRLADRARDFVRQPRTRKAAIWTLGGFVVLGLFGFLLAPPLAKWLLQDALSQALHRKVSIERIAINPYTLTAEAGGVSVQADDGHELAGLDAIRVNFQLSSLFRGGPVIEEFKLDGPRLQLVRQSDGRYDVGDLIDEWSQPSDSPPLRFAVNNIEVSGGKLVFIDQPAGLTHTLGDINLRLPFVSSLPYQTDVYVEPYFSANINGAPLVLEGRTKPFKDSRESELSIDLEQVDLAPYLAYSPIKLPFAVKKGVLDSAMKLVFRQGGTEQSLQLRGQMRLKDLVLQERAGAPLLSWGELAVNLGRADLFKHHFVVDSVHLAGLEGHVRVDPQGRLNWLNLLDRLEDDSEKPAQNAPAQPPAAAPTWSVGEIVLQGARIHWQDASRGKPVEAVIGDLQLSVRQLQSDLTSPMLLNATWSLESGKQIRLKRGEIKDGRIDLAQRQAELEDLALNGLELQVVRDAQGEFDLPRPPALKTAGPENHAAPWELAVRHASLDGALRYEEQTSRGKSVQTLDGLSATLDGFSTAPGAEAAIRLDGRVNQKGAIQAAGQFGLQPLALKLDLDVTGFPLLPVQPLFGKHLNITLVRGQVSAQGKLELNEAQEGFAGGYQGQITLGDLHSIDKLNSADFLKWKSLHIGNINARLQPLSLKVGDVALSDFYARVIVTPEGKINLSQIIRAPGEAPRSLTPETPQAPEKPPSGAQAAATTLPPPAADPLPPIRIGKVSLQGGTIHFSDLFVKPNYTVNVTKVTGRLNGLSSADDTVADLELRGNYGNASPVEVTAKLNPLVPKAFLDLKGEVRGVDLTTLSTYAGKYAGYAIEKGKLSLTVTYKLENNQLVAQNRVFLDQLTFGNKVESAEATSLPVKLAVSLLQNRRGEIDINLPISGSIDDPEFSLGGIIVQVIVNLFVKAVTSPFALLGSLFGDGEELSNVVFDPGYAALTPAATQKLENLSKAMNDRPALNLEITGRIDPEADKEGSQRAAIDRAVKAEKLKDQVRKGVEGDTVESITVDPKEYPEYLRRAYKAASFPKPRNFVGMQKDLPVEEMEKLMLTHLPVSDEDLRQLAVRRAEIVQAWLVEQGKVPMERVFLLPPKLALDDKDGKSDPKTRFSRVDFSLR